MEIIQISKYQSVNDRIKRLTNLAGPQPLPPPSTQLPQQLRKYQNSSYTSHHKTDTTDATKPGSMRKRVPQRMATEEAEPNLNEPSAAYIEELMSMRENRTIKVQSKERTKLKERANTDHSYVEENRQPEKRNIYQLQQQQQPQAETVQDTPEPRKVAVLKQAKSQSTFKIDELMETYNSYKQNKEQFMTEIQNKPKSQQHRRFISSNLKIELEQREKEELEQEQENCHDYSRHSMEDKQNENDYTWSGPSYLGQEEDDEVSPQFERSNNQPPRESTIEPQTTTFQCRSPVEREERPARYLNSKLILKNMASPPAREPSNPMARLLSPRGTRVPGKICKNIDTSCIQYEQ